MKTPITLVLSLVAASLLADPAIACSTARSKAARAAFVKAHPCPQVDPHTAGRCPGYIVDHRVALCVGGKDAASNMQWMTVADAAKKDRWECKPGWKQRLLAAP